MQKIEAIIRPEKLDEVRGALEKVGCGGLMVTEIEGCGKQKGITQQWRGKEYKVDLLSKVKVEIVVNDKEVNSVIKVVMEVARTGEIGDGKIFVSPISNAVRIRTGEKGEVAL